MRALSTALGILALAHPAGAQVFGAPRGYDGAAYWLSVDGGTTRSGSVSDRSSNGEWLLEKSAPIRVAVDYGRRERTIGLALSQASIPVTFDGLSCPACRARVTARQAMATYRISSPLFSAGLSQIVEFSAGATRWSDLAGRDGSQLAAIAPNYDFTYAVAYGIGVPVGERIVLSVRYEMAHVNHEKQTDSPLGATSSGSLGLTTLRMGARLRLGRQ